MKRYVTLAQGFAAAALLLIAGYAQADEYLVRPDMPRIIDNPQTGDTIKVPVYLHNSYCCSLIADTVEHSSGFSSIGPSGSAPIPSSLNGKHQPPMMSLDESGKSRICFSEDLASHTSPVAANFRVLDMEINDSFSSVTVDCATTTLSAGYNTYSSDYLFLELTGAALGSVPPTATVTGISENGAQVFTVAVSVRQRTDVFLNQYVSQHQIGRLVVSHTGAPRTVKAHLAEYRIDNSNLSSGFTLVGRTELTSKP